MKFLVDAQLPHRLAEFLWVTGHEVIHTLDLPMGNRTPDSAINELSLAEKIVVITKDCCDYKRHRLRPVISGQARAIQIATDFNRQYPKR